MPSSRASLSDTLAQFACELDYAALPAPVQQKARTGLLHGLGMALAAYHTRYARYAFGVARGETAGGGSATLLVDGDRVPPTTAAFANGTLLHARTQEDALGPIHLGPAVLPVALAMAETQRSSGREMLAAIAAGYEVAAAIAGSTPPLSTARGFRASPLYGIFGAAVAAGRLLGLDERQMAAAIGFAASMAFGTLETAHAGTTEWRFQVGTAGRSGILAAWLAQQGAEAAPESLEGPLGFYQAFVGAVPDTRDVVGGLGRRFALLDVLLKPFPGCVYYQGPVAALLELLQEERLPAEAIATMEVDLNDYDANYPGMKLSGPFERPSQTGGSLYFAMAAAALEGGLSITSQERYQDPAVAALMQRVQVRQGADRPSLTTRVVVTTADGRHFERECDARRYAALDMSGERAMLGRLQADVPLPPAQVDALAAHVAGLDREPDVRGLVRLLLRADSSSVADSVGASAMPGPGAPAVDGAAAPVDGAPHDGARHSLREEPA